MSAGRVATRPWASKTQCLPPCDCPTGKRRLPPRHYPCQDTGSAELPTAFYNKWKPGSELAQPRVVEPGLRPGLWAPRPEAGFLGPGHQTCSWESARGPSLPHVKWGNVPTRLPCSQGPGEGTQCPWSPIRKLRPGAPGRASVPRRRGGAGQAPAGPPPADQLPLGAGGGNRPHLCSQPPRRLPPGRPGQRAQVSHTAGSSASSHPHLHGARGSVTPQGPGTRQAGWPSGCGQARLALMLLPMSLGRLGCPGEFTGTFPTAPSHDPCAHPLEYGLGLPC